MHFLNAVLQPLRPITAVETLNPIQHRDRSDAKLAIWDVLAQVAHDHRYNIEMQTTLPVDYWVTKSWRKPRKYWR